MPEDQTTYSRDVVHELIELTMAAARKVNDELQAQPAPPAAATADGPPRTNTPALADAFERLARAVRRGVLLAQQLEEPAAAGRDAHGRHAAERRQVIRGVEDAIQRAPASPAQQDSLQAELMERMDGPDLLDEIGHRPAAAIIQDICRDLGLAHMPGTHPWKRRTPGDIAELCLRAANGGAAPGGGPPPPGPPGSRLAPARPGILAFNSG